MLERINFFDTPQYLIKNHKKKKIKQLKINTSRSGYVNLEQNIQDIFQAKGAKT